MGINVLSLCDGMSCGQISIKKNGIDIENYYASEIEKSSIKITMKNFPKTIEIGNMIEIDEECVKGLPKIDLILSGTPCRDLSVSTRNGGSSNWDKMHKKGEGLNGEHSILFYKFVEIIDLVKKHNNQDVLFLFENVESMTEKDKTLITELLCVEPIMIDSKLVSAQNRKRLYWTNIEGVVQPEDKGIMLKDIILSKDEVYDMEKGRVKFWYENDFIFLGNDKTVCAELKFDFKAHDIVKRVYNTDGKIATLTSCRGGNLQKKIYQDGKCRKLTPLEYERCQTVPDGYTEGVSNSARYNMLGDGWTVDVIAHILKNIKEGD